MKPLLRQAQCEHSTIVLSAILNAIFGNGLDDTCRFRNCGRPTDSGLESFFRTFRACYALCTMKVMNRCANRMAKAMKCNPASVSAKRS